MQIKSLIMVIAGLAVAGSAYGITRTYVNARKEGRSVTLTITLNNGQTKTVTIEGGSTGVVDIGDAKVINVKVAGPDRRVSAISRSFEFNPAYKAKYAEIMNSEDKMNFVDDDENPSRSRPFRLMAQADFDNRQDMANVLSRLSDKTKEALKAAAVKVGEAASWLADVLKDIGQTTAGINSVTGGR